MVRTFTERLARMHDQWRLGNNVGRQPPALPSLPPIRPAAAVRVRDKERRLQDKAVADRRAHDSP